MFKGELEGDLEGDLKGYLKGDLKGDFEVDLEVDLEGDFRGDFKQDLEGDLLSSSGQLRSRSGLVQVWFSIELKFNSFELDSEVGRLVCGLDLDCLYFGSSSSLSVAAKSNIKVITKSDPDSGCKTKTPSLGKKHTILSTLWGHLLTFLSVCVGGLR